MKTIDKDGYERLLSHAEVLERDKFGDKVLRLDSGFFLKLFRVKRVISFKRLYPEYLRFSLHASRLINLGIPTVTVIEPVKVPHLNRTGVLYDPLEGRTLRQVAADGGVTSKLAERLGGFIATLHEKGVYFRSLHLGNIILGPDEELGLIDVADMRIFPWSLWKNTCVRNFHHLLRYPQDMKTLHEAGIETFVRGYTKKRGNPWIEKRLIAEIDKHGISGGKFD